MDKSHYDYDMRALVTTGTMRKNTLSDSVEKIDQNI